MPKRPIERWLARQHQWARRHPWGGLALIGVACVASWFGVSRLSMGGVGEMFDAESPGAVRYREWSQAFDTAGEVVVLIDTGEHGEFAARAAEAAHALGESLREESAVDNVVWGLDRNTVGPKMLLTLPTEQVARDVESLAQIKPLLVSETPAALMRAGMVQATTPSATVAAPGASAEPPDLAEGAALFVGLMETLTQRMNTPAAEPVDLFAALSDTLGHNPWQFMRTANGRLLVVRASLHADVGGEPGYGGSLDALRRHIEAVRARFADVPLGLTGAEPTSREAEAAVRTAAQRALGAGLAALWVLTALAWRDVRRPAAVTAGIGVALWVCLGWSGAVVGMVTQLSLFAIAAGVGLMLYGAVAWCGAGLRQPGVDAAAGITHGDCPGRAAGVGPGVVVAALIWGGVGLATALVPWVETPGVRGAGWVSVGAALAVIAMTAWVLPVAACVLRVRVNCEGQVGGVVRREDLACALGSWARRSRRGAWFVATIILLVAGWGAWQAEYSSNMLVYLPSESEGARWQRRAMEDGGELGLAAAVVAADLREAAAITERLRAMPEVARVTGVARMVPEDMARKREVLAGLDRELGAAARRVADETTGVSAGASPTDLLREVTAVRFGLSLLGKSLPEEQQPLAAKMDRAAAEFLSTAASLEPATLDAQLAALQQDYTACRQRVGQLLAELLEDRDLSLDDIGGAAAVFSPWVSGAGAEAWAADSPELTLKVYPATAAGGWPTNAEMKQFFAAVREVAPQATGDLERFASGTAALRKDFGVVMILILMLTGSGLGAWARSWRVGLASALVLGASGFAMAATVGWLGQPVGLVAAVGWVLVAALVVAWLSQLAGASRRPIAVIEQDSGAAEAFGLTLAVGFVIAAGLRGAQAPGITAVAIGVCVGLAGAGLLGLLVIHSRRVVVRPVGRQAKQHWSTDSG